MASQDANTDDRSPAMQFLYEETDGLKQHAGEQSMYSFRERLFVMNAVAEADRASIAQSGSPMSPARLKVVERLAWALFDASYGYCDRVADDLDGIEADLAAVEAGE